MKKYFLFFFVCICFLASRAVGAPVPVESGRMLLNGDDWLLAVVTPAGEADFKDFPAPAPSRESQLRPVEVPSNWEMQGFEDARYVATSDNVGYYRKSFDAPAVASGERVMLHFEGVQYVADVWVNGEKFGKHKGSYTGFEYDVTDALRPGQKNELAVRVTKSREMTHQFDCNDAWALSGIYRDVYLYKLAPVHLDVIQIETDLDDTFTDAELILRMGVKNTRGGAVKAAVRATLNPPDGDTVGLLEKVLDIPAGETEKFVLTNNVINPLKWTAETPDLYELKVEILEDGQVVSTTVHNVGFREVTVSGGLLLVNGVPVKLRGVNRHEINIERGRALITDDWLQDIELMKRGNINTVRTSHYPPDPEFLDLCDEHGFYVIDEVPFGYGDEMLHIPDVLPNLRERTADTIARDRNHPSVIIWSLGNENPWSYAHPKLVKMAHKLDASRPVLLPRTTFEGGSLGTDLPVEVDIMAPHYPSPERLRNIFDANRDNPRPVIMTEYLHALGRHWFTREIWDAVWEDDMSAGGCVWLWADQGIKRPTHGTEPLTIGTHTQPYDKDTLFVNRPEDRLDRDRIIDTHGIYGADGIVNADRSPQPDYFEIKKIYSPIFITDEQLIFEHGQKGIEIALQNRYDFTDIAGMRYEWELLDNYYVVLTGEGTYAALAPHETGTQKLNVLLPQSPKADRDYLLNITSFDKSGMQVDLHQIILTPTKTVTENPADPAWCEPMGEEPEDEDGLSLGSNEFGIRIDRATGLISGAHKLDQHYELYGPALNTYRPVRLVEIAQPAFFDNKLLPLLQGMAPEVKSMELLGNDLMQQRARVEVFYALPDGSGRGFDVTYDYLVRCSGRVEIDYEIRPRVGEEPLLELGMAFSLPADFQNLTVTGRGPDTYAQSIRNTEVSMLGKMSFTPTDADFSTNKTDVRRAGLSNGDLTLAVELPAPQQDWDNRNLRATHSDDATILFLNPYVKHPSKKNSNPPPPRMITVRDGDVYKSRLIIVLPMEMLE